MDGWLIGLQIFSVYSEDLLAVLADCERALLLAPAAMHPHQHDSTVLLARKTARALFAGGASTV